MSAQAIYRRWRPQSFEDVIGQDHIVQTLRNALRGDRLAHAYLFTGPRGTGKTSVARILAKAVNCVAEAGVERPCNACGVCRSMTEGRALDLIEIDAASNTGVDDVRDLREKIGFSPNEARYKVYIIDEVHMLSSAAFNALLKTLEEPPPHAIFVLATTEPHKIPDTILSRCQRHDFRRVDLAAVTQKLARICAAEGAEADPEALELIARSGTGSIRDAESLLDQLAGAGLPISVEAVREALGTPADEAVADLVDALLAQDAAAGLALINAALDRGANPRQLQDRLLEHLRGLLLVQTGLDQDLLQLPEERLARLREQAALLPMPLLVQAIHRFNEARPGANRALPSLPLELALVETALAMGAAAAPVEPQTVAPAQPTPSVPTPANAPARPEPGDAAPAKRPAAQADPLDATPTGASKRGLEAPAGRDAAGDPADADSRAPAPPPAATQVPDLANLAARWPEVLRAVELRDRNLAALLKDSRPIASDAKGITLGFFYEFHCRRASQPEKMQLIAEAMAALVGGPVTLRCTVVSESKAEAERRPRSKRDQAAQDPVVKHALDKLGARIAGVQDPEPED
ncbi:MAG: DNA polymerase III subunit gamma/tau [Chloroflexi bacterium]|nr:DNA polymerase III subunit gamma/tau [Chloroflexota bacterium]